MLRLLYGYSTDGSEVDGTAGQFDCGNENLILDG